MRWLLWLGCASCAGGLSVVDVPADTTSDTTDTTSDTTDTTDTVDGPADTAEGADTPDPADTTDPDTVDTTDPVVDTPDTVVDTTDTVPDPVDTPVDPTDTVVDTHVVDTPPAPREAADLVPGDLWITEFMADPDDCDDGEAEYIELVHPGNDTIALQGVVLEDDNHQWTFPAVTLGPQERLLLVRNPAPQAQCYGLAGLTYERDLGLDASGDRLTLTGPTGVRIERVDFGSWDVDAGVAWERDDNNPAVWCDADRAILGATDLGSPGAPNGICAP